MNRSTNFNFYLPENTDPIDVNDFNYNFEQIDEEIFETNDALDAISASISSEDVTLTAASGFTKRTSCRMSRCGGIVTVDFDVKPNATTSFSTSYTQILTFPNDVNPSSDVFGIAWAYDSSNLLCVDVYNGAISVKAMTGTFSLSDYQYIRGSITWIVGK